MRHFSVLGLAALLGAACENAAGPKDTFSLGRGLTADVVMVDGNLNSNAVLSNDLVVTGSPISYGVDFGTSFSAISEFDYFFTFGDDPLDAGECLEFTIELPTGAGAGVCNVGTTPQTSRLLTFPCPLFPAECNLFLDGLSSGEIFATTFPASAASVRIASLTVTLLGAVQIPQQGIQQLAEFMRTLVANGGLSVGNARALQATLRASMEQLDKANGTAAINALNAFVNQVNALVLATQLSSSDGERLTTLANRILGSIDAT